MEARAAFFRFLRFFFSLSLSLSLSLLCLSSTTGTLSPCPRQHFFSLSFLQTPPQTHTKKTAALGVLDAAAGLQQAANPAPRAVPQRRKRERRPTGTEGDEGGTLPRRASGRIAAAGTRNYNERSFFSFSSYSSSLGDREPASAASRAAPKGPPRVPSSCHSCRQKRDEMGGPAAEGSSCWRCDGARGRFCRGCLSMRYGLSVEAIKLANERAAAELARREEEEEGKKEEEEGKKEEGEGEKEEAEEKEEAGEKEEGNKEEEEKDGRSDDPPSLPSPCGWLCPHCYEEVFGAAHGWICNSSLCLKKRKVPIRPTGVAVFESRAAGHASVAHALQARLLAESGRPSGGLVGPRREGLGLVIEGLTDLGTGERRRAEEKEERGRRERAAAAADAGAAAAAAADDDDAASGGGGVASAAAAAAAPPPPAAAAGKENVGDGENAAKRPRGRPPKSAGGGGGGARAAAQAAPPPSLPLAASAALPQPAA